MRLCSEGLEDRSLPSTFLVTNPNDSGPGSLRQAVAAANVSMDADTIQFAPSLAGQTINLTTVGDLSIGPSALMVTSPVDIIGDGETIARSGGANFRLFAVNRSGNLSLLGLTLSGGLALGGAGSDGGGGAAGFGGAVFNQGTLLLISTTVVGNQAIGGSLIDNGGGGGGGLDGQSILGNGGFPNGGPAFGGGGGIAGEPNGAPGGFGGGGGSGYVGGSGGFGGGGGNGSIAGGAGGFGAGDGGNLLSIGAPGESLGQAGSGFGGAVFNQGGTVVISNSTITGNLARGGDAVAVVGKSGGGFGGAIFNLDGALSLINDTIANDAVSAGAVMFPQQISIGGTADGEVVSAAYPNVGTQFQTSLFTLANTIITHSGIGSAITTFEFSAANVSVINATGPNIVFGTVNHLSGTITGTPFTFVDPLLGPLEGNGGLTRTMAPAAGSMAIDSGSNAQASALGLTIDERGFDYPRVYNGTVDLGAVEVQPPPHSNFLGVPQFAVGADAGGSPVVTSFGSDGSPLATQNVFDPAFTGGIRTAVADFNGDGTPDLAVGTGPGTTAEVEILDGRNGTVSVRREAVRHIPGRRFRRGRGHRRRRQGGTHHHAGPERRPARRGLRRRHIPGNRQLLWHR